MSKLDERLNKEIGAWLLEPNHTKAMLAEALGMSVNTLTRRLSDGAEWRLSEVVAVSNFIGCDLDEQVS